MTGKLLRETRRSAESFHQFCSRFGRQQSQDVVCPGRFLVRFVEPFTDFEPEVGETRRAVLCDAMTSGGLLIAVGPENAHALEDALAAVAPESARIGELTGGEPGRISVHQ